MKIIIYRILLQSLTLLSVAGLLTCCTSIPSAQDQMHMIEQSTGFKPTSIDGASADYLEKEFRGYKLLLRVKVGDVWGRYAARVTAGEIGRELGGIWSFLTGSYKSGVGSTTGSPFDRLLSDMIGQPITLSIFLDHKKKTNIRADIYNTFSRVKPYDTQPKIKYLELGAGTLYSNDHRYADAILSNKDLLKRIEVYRSQYIRVDNNTVSFIFSGSENDYSAMIRNAGGYSNLLNSISETVADLANLL